MKKSIFILLLLVFFKNTEASPVDCVKINEVFFSSSGNDWVELCLYSSEKISADISGLFITTYYGTNEQISQFPVTLYSFDRKETPYDDRYAVIYFTSNQTDETDLRGDVNRNGRLDLYCQNYSGSLWNNEGIVALDTNDEPSDGLLDFIYYSSCDGLVSSLVESNLNEVINIGHWIAGSGNVQNYSVNVSDVPGYCTICRKSGIDSNSADDFMISAISTPGKNNIFRNLKCEKYALFKLQKRKLIFSKKKGTAEIPLFFKKECSITFKLFSNNGIIKLRQKKIHNVCPGDYEINFKVKKFFKPGIYIGVIEGYNEKFNLNQKLKFIVIIAE